ncbi:hypothetical protein QN224_29900 [Sinorhizobium sp. 8-89]|uniref:hypothetical protein n=1 Tax=Sinorhizobium sp. 7-81 TaxID=3049087 RepID=UPI0024C45A36|nr:hypothetical protein [Sinorhizobium sp. 7-81]MDK1389597.1 hypothetical protein [Sinorhizobium sp. 7-81]
MSCENLVGGCFSGDRAPFALHESDRRSAVVYLQCCVENSLRWSDVETQIRAYLAPRGSGEHYVKWVDQQIQQAQKMFLPWLEEIDTDQTNVVDIR